MMYQQETDVELIKRLTSLLRTPTAVDVGAERGDVVAALLEAGAACVIACEAFPPHVAHLRARYATDPRVHVIPGAISSSNGSAVFHVAQDLTGDDLGYFHSLEDLGLTSAHRGTRDISVTCRTLGSLVEDGTIDQRIGVLKIDTEGHDFEVIRGLGQLRAEVLIAEYWDGLQDVVGPCPFSLKDLSALAWEFGYHTFGFLRRHDQFELMQVNCDETRPGDWGNVFFIHTDADQGLVTALYDAAAAIANRLLDQAIACRRECDDRLRVINQLSGGVDAANPGGQDVPPVARLHGLNGPHDIGPVQDYQALQQGGLPADGLFVGNGWYPFEAFAGEEFRWSGSRSEIVVTRPTGTHRELLIDLEPGPSLVGKKLELLVVGPDDSSVAQHSVSQRSIVSLTVPIRGDDPIVSLFLEARNAGAATRGDPRPLNFRVFRIAWNT